ncbi:MAG: sarcosine oxidase subunit alpha family protein [Litoreibacter sp.]
MSLRLTTGGRLIDRTKPMKFTFNGKTLRGVKGDTLASALLANDQLLMGRSFKYHRPRGVMSSGAEEPNALFNLGKGGRFEPNARATTTELFDGLISQTQNHFPSLEFDVGVLNNYAARLLPAGFYYKTFIHPRAAWKHVFEPIIRKSAGLGAAPTEKDADSYEHFNVFVDVLIVGGGVAGLQSARIAGEAGLKVLLVEQTAHWGGRAPVDGGKIDGMPADEWISSAVQDIENMPNVTLQRRCMGSGIYDHGYALAYERITDHAPNPDLPRHRLWRIRAKQILTTTGALERPLSFAGNDVPGVMLASAVRDYAANFAIGAGEKTVVVTNNDDAYHTAFALLDAGLAVPAIIDARADGGGAVMDLAIRRGMTVLRGMAISNVLGGKRVTGVAVCAQDGDGSPTQVIYCDAVAMSGGWSPVVHLWSHCGGKLNWDDRVVCFRPDPERAPQNQDGDAFVTVAGAANGEFELSEVIADATFQTGVMLRRLGKKTAETSEKKSRNGEEAPILPVWQMPAQAPVELRAKMWLDFQNDVKVSDVQLAAQEGYESVEHTKRYTTLGMATDQGKLSNINGLAVLSDSLGKDIPDVGTTTFRPPYTPISMGAIAGEASGDRFQPLRKTAIHGWGEANGAYWEPVGQWRRAYCYQRGSETIEEAVNREVKNTRQNLGLLDASTLGKIIVKGPDAGKFLDMMYTNMMSSLPTGKCRYGLMCNENGFLMDDGVVVRLSEDTWLCHTTTGGAEAVHSHMEEWLQTEWWDWKVFTANVTEQYAQIAVVGPNARKVLEALGGMDVSPDALPFMTYAEGKLGDVHARVFRISFSGELSYEIAVPASQGRALWDKLHDLGAEFGTMAYGTECLHVLRAEKGFIMIGDETDGTVIPQDLGLNWALSKKKSDYLGKRAHERSHMADPARWKLVGLEALDGSVLPDGAYSIASGKNANGQTNTDGRVTSTYFSANLDKGIAMGLVLNGPDRMDETLSFTNPGGEPIKAKIVNAVFYDPDGEKQNV